MADGSMNKNFRIKTVRWVDQKANTKEQAIKRARRKGYINPQSKIESVKESFK